MWSRSRTILLVALALLAAGCGDDGSSVASTTTTSTTEATTTTATTTPAPATTTTTTRPPADYPRFEPGPCPTPELTALGSDGTHDIECGNVIVPQDYSDSSSRPVYLPVAIARTRSAEPKPDPVIYLAGGGGHDHLKYAHFFMESVGDTVLETRDFIQYNQRGAWGTDPELRCPGYTNFLFQLARSSELGSVWTTAHHDYLDDCWAALSEEGVDLTQYNSAVNGADAQSVRIALGYDEANFYGTSYGTRLGLDLMRDHPDGVRSMILDSVYPPEVGYYSEYPLNMHRTFQYLFDACAADPDCSTAFPDLEADFYATAQRLNDEPVSTEVPYGGDPRGLRMFIDGGMFMDGIALYLYSPDWIPRVPDAINRVANGDLGPIRTVAIGAITAPDISFSMFYAMQCREEVPFETFEEAETLSEDLPEVIRIHYLEAFTRFHFGMCDGSMSGVADPVEAAAVVSDVPTLVVSGGFDPATPARWSEATAAALTNATYVHFPTEGHGIVRSNECGLEIALAFWDEPDSPLDTSCVDSLPPVEFVTP